MQLQTIDPKTEYQVQGLLFNIWLNSLFRVQEFEEEELEEQKIPYILVIGDKEAKGSTLNVRMRGNIVKRMTKKQFLDKILDEIKNKKT